MVKRNRTASFKEPMYRREDFNLQDYGRSSRENNFLVISEAFKLLQFPITKVSLIFHSLHDVKTLIAIQDC